MRPKPIKIRVKHANGKNQEIILEDVVYLDVLELREQKVKFVIDLDTKWKEKLNVMEVPKLK